MSKSLKRVIRALEESGVAGRPQEMAEGTRTAADAARAIGCALDQIAKSIIFQGQESGDVVLFLTAGGNQVDPEKASALAGEALGRADAAAVRAQTGFAIGGVAPLGHLTPVRAFIDPRLATFDVLWAAAGTPRHVFPISAQELERITGAIEADFTV